MVLCLRMLALPVSWTLNPLPNSLCHPEVCESKLGATLELTLSCFPEHHSSRLPDSQYLKAILYLCCLAFQFFEVTSARVCVHA